MKTSEKDMNQIVYEVRKPKLQEIMPEPTPRYLALVWDGYMLDAIDLALLAQCNQNPGQPIINTIKPLLGARKVRTLYDRMRALEAQQFVEIDRSQKKVYLATITEKGKAAISRTGGTVHLKADGESQ